MAHPEEEATHIVAILHCLLCLRMHMHILMMLASDPMLDHDPAKGTSLPSCSRWCRGCYRRQAEQGTHTQASHSHAWRYALSLSAMP